MTDATRQRLTALYQEHVEPRTDGGLPLNVDDHVSAIEKAAQFDISDREMAEALGVPVNYVMSFKAAMRDDACA